MEQAINAADIEKGTVVRQVRHPASQYLALFQFRYARLPNSDLTGVNLTGADLSVADLRGNLNEANLTRADLRGADLTGANLIGANLTLSNMFDAKLAEAKMARIKMEGAIGPHGQRVGAKVAGRRKSARPWWQFWG